KPDDRVGINRSGYLRRPYSLPAMRLFEYRVPADDPKIYDACTRGGALRSENYSQGVLLPGLSLHLDQPGGAHHWAAVASVLSWRGDQLDPSEKRTAKADDTIRDAENAQRSTLNAQRSTGYF